MASGTDGSGSVRFELPPSWRRIAPDRGGAEEGRTAPGADAGVSRRARGGRSARNGGDGAAASGGGRARDGAEGDLLQAWLAEEALDQRALERFEIPEDDLAAAARPEAGAPSSDDERADVRRASGGRRGAAAPRDGSGSGAERDGADGGAAEATGSGRVTVEVSATEHAVMLVEEEGVFRWVFPEEDAESAAAASAGRRRGSPRGARAAEPARRAVHFRFSPLPSTPDAEEPRGRRRGGAGGRGAVARVRSIVTRVFTYPADWLIGRALDRLEPDAIEGAIDLGAAPDSRSAARSSGAPGPESALDWTPAARPLGGIPATASRMLLLVHGTFSSTAGSFGGLLATDEGRRFLAAARARYGAVVGFDHRTLRLPPRANAEDIVDAIARALGARRHPIEIDAIAFSRGGLVLRQVVAVAAERGIPVRFGKMVFVACANDGTQLARRENWNRLVDLSTTLAVAGCNAAARAAGAAAPPVAVAARLLAASTTGIASFVKLLAARALRDGKVPGLAAMDPDADDLRSLRRAPAWVPAGASAATVTASFDIALAPANDAELAAVGLGVRVKGWLAEGFMRALMKGAENDLVVDLASMRSLGGGAAAPSLDYGTQWRVFHTRYFVEPRTAEHLGRWLGLIDGAGAVITLNEERPDPQKAPERGAPEEADDPDELGGSGLPDDPDDPDELDDAEEYDDSVDVSDPGGRRPSLGWSGIGGAGAGEDERAASEDESSSPRSPWRGSASARASDLGARGGRGAGSWSFEIDRPGGRTPDPPLSEEPPPHRRGRARGSASIELGRTDESRKRGASGGRGGREPGSAAADAGGRRRGSGRDRAGSSSARREPVHVRAECDARLQRGRTRTLRIEIAREALALRGDPASVGGTAELERDRSVIVEVTAKSQIEIVGEDRAEIAVPEPGSPAELAFDIRGTDLGPAELWVSLRQRAQPLLRLVLRPEVVAASSAAGSGRVVADGVPELPRPELTAVPTLMIHEQRNGDELRYLFSLAMPDGRVFSGRSEPIRRDRGEYVAGLYDDIEKRWLASRGDRTAFAEELKARGVELFRELLPRDLQAAIWHLRDQIRAIRVLSEEPFIPWELVHPAPPLTPFGGRPAPPAETRFLAQMGLVRWLYGPVQPPTELWARPGRVFHLVPDYPDPGMALPGAAEERSVVENLLGAAPAPGALAALQSFLRDGAFDLLHFAGHGEAAVGRVDGTRLLLEGRVSGSTWIPESIGPSTVETLFHLDGEAMHRPLLMLNACQAGRSGWRLTSVGGFAEAFLGGNAGAFVGALWEVGDAPALGFGRHLYERLLAGDSLADAAIAARERSRGAGDATWLAYVVYGNPFARLRTSP
ncbi:MAG TPA: CHAT domain-containing protein [Phycisphaerales bacterium]|nr:CHAT domain-containing protein [Phycisphaerales bacterium]HMP36932.1 CHAT domain-containing protein [Phycisphaerales bacterium]